MLTVKQVAERLQISQQSVYLLIQRGKLVTHRFGAGRGTIRVSEEDLDAFIESCRYQKAESAPKPRHIKATSLKHIRL